jgi:RNA polymerase sigma factor (sigma-70 family)
MDGDAELLRDYAINRSDRAFARLVERHIDLVYSAALRRVGGDPHRAAEVTQMVFIDLARKASSLVRHSALVGWLHQSTRWAASNLRRAEQRRATHERAAAIELLNTHAPEAHPVEWDALRPLLDQALDELRDADREAVLLRYFNNYSFAEVGRQLGTGENAARMRVERALDKLHGILRRKGLAGGVAALGATMAKNAVAAAPAELAAAVTPAATAAGSIVAGAGVGGAAAILMSKATMALIGAGVATLAVLCLQQQQTLAAEREALVRVREQHAARQAEVARIATQVERLQGDLARLPSAAELPPPDPVELERKRLDMVVRKGELDIFYGPLFRRLKLAPGQLDALKTLLVERNQAIHDANQLAKQEGVESLTFAEQKEVGRQASEGVDAEIVALIGSERFALLSDFSRPYGAFGLLDQSPDQIDEPEHWDRAKRLGDLWERTNSHRSLEEATRGAMSDEFIIGAKSIMTAQQFHELLEENQSAVSFARMLELQRAAAYAGKLKLSRKSEKDYTPGSTAVSK